MSLERFKGESPKLLLLCLVSAATGKLAWSGEILLLPVSACFPALWSLAARRYHAMLVALCYFLAASRGLPQGVVNFYGSDLLPGIALWLLASLSFVLIHGLCWTPMQGLPKMMAYLAVSLALSLPPFGTFGWAHPWTAAGVLFPDWGWLGLLALVVCFLAMTGAYRFLSLVFLASFWAWSALSWKPAAMMPGWYGLDLQMGSTLGRETGLAMQMALLRRVSEYPKASVVVLPESALGYWTPTLARIWEQGLTGTGITVIAGAVSLDADGYDNLLVKIRSDASDRLYRQRMPVPGAMWQPWSYLGSAPAGARAHYFANPVVEVSGQTIAPLICYEQLLIWPVLQSALYQPDVLVGVANSWWTSKTAIAAIQGASLEAWSRLFGIPQVSAFNR